MTSAPTCKNDTDLHRGWWQMTRLYVRRNKDGKRTWDPIGWVCDPNGDSNYWRGKGCGNVVLDTADD